MSDFFQEFSDFVSGISTNTGKLLIVGNMNFHMENLVDKDSRAFADILFCSGLTQHCVAATHDKGHCLDLVITKSVEDMSPKIEINSVSLSDHYPLLISLDIEKPPKEKKHVSFRKLKDNNKKFFSSEISLSTLVHYPAM